MCDGAGSDGIDSDMDEFLSRSVSFVLAACCNRRFFHLRLWPRQAAPPCLLLLQLRPVYLPKATFTPPDKQKQQRQQLKWSTS